MKAVVYQGINDLQVKDVAEPHIEEPTDAIIKVNLSSICGGDIHLKSSEAIKPAVKKCFPSQLSSPSSSNR